MKANAALVRTDGVVVLNAITHIGLHVALVVHPCHTEGDDAVRYAKTLNEVGTVELGMAVILILNGTENLAHSLDVLRLVGEALVKTLYDFCCFHCFLLVFLINMIIILF